MEGPSMTSQKTHKHTRKTILTVLALALVGGGLALSAMLKAEKTVDSSKLATVARGDLARSVVATGKIQPLAKVEVKSKASGIVKQLMVHYGDHVKQGQVLAELDKEELQARVREARASLMAAQAALESVDAAHARNQAEAEGADLPFLRSAAERAQQLNREGLI